MLSLHLVEQRLRKVSIVRQAFQAVRHDDARAGATRPVGPLDQLVKFARHSRVLASQESLGAPLRRA